MGFNGWNILTKTGIYGTDCLDHALVAAVGCQLTPPTDRMSIATPFRSS
jgi:hypothetical protein